MIWGNHVSEFISTGTSGIWTQKNQHASHRAHLTHMQLDAFNSQDSSSQQCKFPYVGSSSTGNMTKTPEKAPHLPWDSSGVSMKERGTERRLHLRKCHGALHPHFYLWTHSYPFICITSIHKYTTRWVLESWVWESSQSDGDPGPVKNLGLVEECKPGVPLS